MRVFFFHYPQRGIVWAPKREEWQMPTPVVAIETETKATPEPKILWLVLIVVFIILYVQAYFDMKSNGKDRD